MLWRIDVAYNGQGLHGFQSQPDGKTVQDKLENALKIVTRQPVKIIGGSRTDSAVHAEHQVCMFNSDAELDGRKSVRALNALLPEQIRVYKLYQVEDSFHPHLSSQGKIYRYRLWRGFCLDPFSKPYVWEVKPEIDFSLLLESMKKFVGEHDFTSFTNTGSVTKTNVREIREIKVIEKGPLIEIWVDGKGFLKQMVRNLVGTAAEAALGKTTLSIEQTLEAKDRAAGGQTAPGNALCLVRSNFEGDVSTIAEEISRASHGLTSQVLG
jgi:tRNA pseudouridine38-40 synthase